MMAVALLSGDAGVLPGMVAEIKICRSLYVFISNSVDAVLAEPVGHQSNERLNGDMRVGS
jgi:hypothetical protein